MSAILDREVGAVSSPIDSAIALCLLWGCKAASASAPSRFRRQDVLAKQQATGKHTVPRTQDSTVAAPS